MIKYEAYTYVTFCLSKCRYFLLFNFRHQTTFDCNDLEPCVKHSVTKHSDKLLTIRAYVLNIATGLFGNQTKPYSLIQRYMSKIYIYLTFDNDDKVTRQTLQYIHST